MGGLFSSGDSDTSVQSGLEEDKTAKKTRTALLATEGGIAGEELEASQILTPEEEQEQKNANSRNVFS